ncbi:MAG: hypothetical protein ACD_50C00389G0007 [uncultured bacterium]|nr:MAG: hypothetical protein ACD_50C00389G0007 [uncultured bacterium]
MVFMNNDSDKINKIIFDLDGVIRIYKEQDTTDIEIKYGLEEGIINKFAFRADLLKKVTTGKLKRSEWVDIIGKYINNMDAAIDWENRPVYIDNNVISIVKELKSKEMEVYLLTNGTDNLNTELSMLGINNEFKFIFNSTEIGVAKPSIQIFNFVLDYCNELPTNFGYIDDNIENIETARSLGINSFLYQGVNCLREWLINNKIQINQGL